MISKSTALFYKRKISIFVEKGLYPTIILILFGLLCWQIYTVSQVREDLAREQTKRDALKAKFDKYKGNIKISDQDQAVFGLILKRQIPTKESPFDLFSLIDKFSQTTSLDLTSDTKATNNFTNNAPISGSVPYTTKILTAKGLLTEKMLTDILQIYQYQFHRFMTLNQITVASSNTVVEGVYDVNFVFGLYTFDSMETAGESQEVFTAQDIATFDMYKENANIDLYYETQDAVPAMYEYDTSGTIF